MKNKAEKLIDEIEKIVNIANNDYDECHSVGFDGINYIIQISELIDDYKGKP